MAKVKCKSCKTYIDRDSALRVGLSSFCDDECRFSVPKKKPKPTKKKPVEKLPEAVRTAVLTRDGFRCRLCGKRDGLAFHHVIYKSEKSNKPWQDTVSNGITLCNQTCHLNVVHKNKKRFQPLCLGIIWLREVEGDRTTTIYELEERLKDDKDN